MAGFLFQHPQFVADCADLENYAQGTVSSATNAAQSAALQEGVYDIWGTQDCYVKVNPTANDVTSATGYLLKAAAALPVRILVRSNSKIGAIMATTAGVLSYHRVG